MLDRVHQLLRIKSLEPKEPAVHDLSAGDEVILLGFVLRQEGKKLHLSIAETAWDVLRERLCNSHQAINPLLTAKRAIYGWIAGWGMAFETVETMVERILHIAAGYGFREGLSPDVLAQHVEGAQVRWRRLRVVAGGKIYGLRRMRLPDS